MTHLHPEVVVLIQDDFLLGVGGSLVPVWVKKILKIKETISYN